MITSPSRKLRLKAVRKGITSEISILSIEVNKQVYLASVRKHVAREQLMPHKQLN